MDKPHQLAHRRVKQIFSYLQALNDLRNPVTRHVKEYRWQLWLRNLPEHETVSCSYEQADENSVLHGGTFSLVVHRPTLTSVPPPPDAIVEWLAPGWEKIDAELKVKESMSKEEPETEVIHFADDPERVQLLNTWVKQRIEWVKTERPARDANALFEKLYDLHSTLERESERFELVLGNGILNQRLQQGGVHHPVLFRKMSLAFDPKIPAFTISETDDDVEFYSALFLHVPGADASMIRRRKEELEQGQFHPLGGGDTAGFFRSIVNSLGSEGRFVGVGAITGEMDQPRIGSDPVLFARNRSQGFAIGLEHILEHLESGDKVPGSLVSIAGAAKREAQTMHGGVSEDEVLLTKPANPEQVRIAQQLSSHGAVIVQGPPGTGKTHTIANLIGHLLAQGKRVLVTSHTSKALSRVRDQLVEPLQSLCVSVLGKDAKSREELKRAIDSIASKISSTNAEDLEKRATHIEERRTHLLEQLSLLKKQLLDARTSEYADIVVDGRPYPPSEAARNVLEARESHGWIPTPVAANIPCPLSSEDVQSLYQSNQVLKKELEAELDAGLPDPSVLPSPEMFTQWVSHINKYQIPEIEMGASLWNQQIDRDARQLQRLGQEIQHVLTMVRTKEEWRLEMLDAGREGGGRLEPWTKLVQLITEVNQFAGTVEDQLITHAPSLAASIPLDEQHRLLDEIVSHMRGKGKLSKTKLLMQRKWAALIKELQVERGTPQSTEEFVALLSEATLRLKRKQLVSRWDRMVSQRGGVQAEKLGDRPERKLVQQSKTIQAGLVWYTKTWMPRLNALKKMGFEWDAWVDSTPLPVSDFTELQRLQFASEKLIKLIQAEVQRIYLGELNQKLDEADSYLNTCTQRSSSIILQNLNTSFKARDTGQYTHWYKQLLGAVQYQSILKKRRALLEKLSTGAMQWAHSIQQRIPPHDAAHPPGDVGGAWLWRQLHDELDRRSQLSIDDLQRKIEKTSKELREVTSELVECLAWAMQVRRLQHDDSKRQALIGWLDIMRRIGAGTGKRVPILLREARKLMKKSKSAVPVWVMPLTAVVENFDPRDNKFDVVIIDEASQVDVMGLVALYMAKSVVVVGDHEQVSPAAVGQIVDQVQYLIDEHLQGIPNAALYDGKTSVYDLARQSFGGVIGLREHFRCVPEIIQFSNALSYDFSIRPLRDSSQAAITPHVVAHQVTSAEYDKKVNTREAAEVASLLVACSEQPEYQGKTFGVISLVGEKQAELIEKILRTHLNPVEYEQDLRILCGNPAHFQGDERDVMFLSVVNASTGKPQRLVSADMYRQRFNVAASRARDQMWVVHSLNPKIDLKEGDLRRRLIEHAQDPLALMKKVEEGEHETDSEFERLVLRRLVAKGYKVIPQWKVGVFRIDLVVEGANGQKLAVECDGDRYHPPEKLSEDMERQAILERLGWTFTRIRGSVFFRDPDAAMQPVFQRLEDMGIGPVGQQEVRQPSTEGNKLLDRIRRRAAELRKEWEAAQLHKKPHARRARSRKSEQSLSIQQDKKLYLKHISPN